MKVKNLWITVALLAMPVAIIVLIKGWNQDSSKQPHARPNEARTESASTSTKDSPSNMDSRLAPAHYEVPPSLGDLPPLLSASQFSGKTREAYDAVKHVVRPARSNQTDHLAYREKQMTRKPIRFSSWMHGHWSALSLNAIEDARSPDI